MKIGILKMHFFRQYQSENYLPISTIMLVKPDVNNHINNNSFLCYLLDSPHRWGTNRLTPNINDLFDFKPISKLIHN